MQRFMQETGVQRFMQARFGACLTFVTMIAGCTALSFAPAAPAAAAAGHSATATAVARSHHAKPAKCVTSKSKKRGRAGHAAAVTRARKLKKCKPAPRVVKKPPAASVVPASKVGSSVTPSPVLATVAQAPEAAAPISTPPPSEVLTPPLVAAPVSTVPPAIIGTAVEGQPLQASSGSWSESPTSYAYQWQLCSAAGEACADIAAATASSFTVPAHDRGHTLRVVVTASNAGGSTSASSAASPVLAAKSQGVLIGSSALQAQGDTDSGGLAEAFENVAAASGTVHSLDLYVNTGNTAPLIEVGLYSNVSGHAGSLLADGVISSPTAGAWDAVAVSSVAVSAGTVYWLAALAPTGTLAIRDVPSGSAPSQNSASDSLDALPAAWSTGESWANSPASFYASTETVESPPPPPPAPSEQSAPSVSGSALEGKTLSASTGTWLGSPTSYAYQWQDCNAAGEGCTNAGATGTTYKLSASDVGHTVRVVVTATNAGGSTPASSVPTALVAASGGSCTTTVTPSTGAAAIASDIVAAANGATICLAAGSYPAIDVVGAAHTAYVTIRPAAGATAAVAGMEVADSSFLRFEGLHMTEGFNMRDASTSASHDYQFIENTFENDAYGIVLYGGSAPISKVLIERNYMRNIDFPGESCSKPTYAGGQAVTLFDAEGVTIADNRFKEVSWHYIQGGSQGPAGVTVEHNLFEGPIQADRLACTHLNVWQIWQGGEDDVFRDNIVRGEPGHPAAITPILFETETSSGTCTGAMSKSTVSNNLFVDDAAAYSIQVMTTQGLTVTHNTVVGSSYGTIVYKEEACPNGSDYDVSNNIDVANSAGTDLSLGGCEGACTFEYNVSEDASAERAPETQHFLSDWNPSWITTSWNPETEPTPPAGYYIPTGLPFAAGYEGAVGP
jgi:hypothetical protein